MLRLLKSRKFIEAELIQAIEKGKELISKPVYPGGFHEFITEFGDWNMYNLEILQKCFSEPNNEYYWSYRNVHKYAKLKGADDDIPSQIDEYKEIIELHNGSMRRTTNALKLIEEPEPRPSLPIGKRAVTNTCFIVHGHDHKLMHEVARFVEKDLEKIAVILHEQASNGQTVIEKFERHSTVDFAIAIWTADDYGNSVNKIDKPNARARQNVVFETGYFSGRLGRSKIIVLHENGVELPSDYGGVVFISIAANWKDDLRKEVTAIYAPTLV